ncbi:MAG: hypothetical protein J6I73_06105 [Treponema sp.]|nr:hypothetical protein [Treponema sp.]
MKINRYGIIFLAALAVIIVSCVSTNEVIDSDPAVGKGVAAWNTRGPSAASAHWEGIKDASKRDKWLNYVTLYEDGKKALDSTDAIKASNEARLLSACNTALTKFSALDSSLELPDDVREKGANLTAQRVDKLLASEKLADARKMYTTAVDVYGSNDALTAVKKEIDVVGVISSEKASLVSQIQKIDEKADFDTKIAAYDAIIAKYQTAQTKVNATVKQAGVGDTSGVAANVRSFNKVRQDVAIQRAAAFRDEAYTYRDRMGEEFARQAEEGSGTGKNGEFTVYDIRNHYQAVGKNMDDIFAELQAFAAKYPNDVGADIIAEAKAQKDDLNAKIRQINQEIAVKEEIESRGKTVMPLIIGLFNPDPNSSASNQKSRPAKFSATKQKNNEYWWGMVEIPRGKMNDLVITLKDNRTVRVFDQNTHSGKDIERKKIPNLVSMQNKVGNSWPVLNAGSQLSTNKYFFEIQKGKTDSYSGEVVVYNSFVVRSR